MIRYEFISDFLKTSLYFVYVCCYLAMYSIAVSKQVFETRGGLYICPLKSFFLLCPYFQFFKILFLKILLISIYSLL